MTDMKGMLFLLDKLDESAGTETQSIWVNEFMKVAPTFILDRIKTLTDIGQGAPDYTLTWVQAAVDRFDEHQNVHQVSADDIRLFIRASDVFCLVMNRIKKEVT